MGAIFRGIFRAIDGPYLDSGGDPVIFIIIFVVISLLIVGYRVMRWNQTKDKKPQNMPRVEPLSQEERKAREKERMRKVAQQARMRRGQKTASAGEGNLGRTPDAHAKPSAQSTTSGKEESTPASPQAQREGPKEILEPMDPQELISGYPATRDQLFAYLEQTATKESDPVLVFLRDNSGFEDISYWLALYGAKPSLTLWSLRSYLRRIMPQREREDFDPYQTNRIVAEELRRLPKG